MELGRRLMLTDGDFSMARFSIVIPTYNRARFLRRSIGSALNQTHPDVEIIVSDNASTDDTADVVREYGDRVRYHRNETNLGLWGNFEIAPELATGEFFAWLTDDDIVREDFAARASAALSSGQDMSLYICWAAYSRSISSIKKNTQIHGPIFPIDWQSSKFSILDGLQLVPFNFFETQAMPPAVAYRTADARLGVKFFDKDCLQYNESIMPAAVVANKRFAVDPWIGVIHSHHDEQAHLQDLASVDDLLRQKIIHAEFCQKFMADLPDRWRTLFRDTLLELPVEHRFVLVNHVIHHKENRGKFWNSAPPIVREMRDIILETLPARERSIVEQSYNEALPPFLKKFAKRFVSPRIRATLREARQAWKTNGQGH